MAVPVQASSPMPRHSSRSKGSSDSRIRRTRAGAARSDRNFRAWSRRACCSSEKAKFIAAPALAQVLAEEVERAAAGQRGALGVIATALVAMEAVAGRIDVRGHIGVRLLHRLPVVGRDGGVRLPPVDQKGAHGPAR